MFLIAVCISRTAVMPAHFLHHVQVRMSSRFFSSISYLNMRGPKHPVSSPYRL